MHTLTQFRETPEPIYPRPKLSKVREEPGVVLCDLEWKSEDGASQVAFFDLEVRLTGQFCGIPDCGGYWIRGTIPTYEAFNGCARCLDRNPRWTPPEEGQETYAGICNRLLKQLNIRTDDEPPTPKAPRERRRRRGRTPGLLRLNPTFDEAI